MAGAFHWVRADITTMGNVQHCHCSGFEDVFRARRKCRYCLQLTAKLRLEMMVVGMVTAVYGYDHYNVRFGLFNGRNMSYRIRVRSRGKRYGYEP